MPDPAVSIIIPTLDRLDLLRRAIDSALVQTYADLECVVVVDGPFAEVTAFAGAHPDPRVRVLQRETNGGAGAARNSGIAAATGRYIGFLDDDDLWLPTKLERQVPLLDAGASVVHSLVYVADSNGDIYERASERGFALFRAAAAEDFPYLRLLRQSSFQISSFLVRRTCIDEIDGFDPDLATVEDLDFVHRLWRRYPLTFVDEPLTKYCIYDRDRSLPRDPDVWRRFAEKELAWVADANPPERREAEAYLQMQIAQAYWVSRKYRKAVVPMARALRRDRNVMTPRTVAKYATAAVLPAPLVNRARRQAGTFRTIREPDPWLDLPSKTTGIASASARNAKK